MSSRTGVWAWGLVAMLGGLAPGSAEAETMRLIFDTDIGNDVDDVLALGLIHALASRGQCRLLAVTSTKSHPASASLVDAINTFYGCGEIPVGLVRDGKTPDAGRFLGMAEQRDGDRLRYPHDLRGEAAADATALLREVLADQPDGSVVMVQVGFSTNLARLLDTPGDNRSALAGRELVARKVRLLSIMAGAFRSIGKETRYREYNIVQDIPAARRLAKDWPTPIVFSGFEIGISVAYPAVSIERDFGYVPHHPLAEAYRLYEPPPHNRPTWDLTSVLYAAYPDRGYFELSPPGRVTVEDDGFTRFEAEENGPHRYLLLPEAAQDRVVEALVQLSSQPPAGP